MVKVTLSNSLDLFLLMNKKRLRYINKINEVMIIDSNTDSELPVDVVANQHHDVSMS